MYIGWERERESERERERELCHVQSLYRPLTQWGATLAIHLTSAKVV